MAVHCHSLENLLPNELNESRHSKQTSKVGNSGGYPSLFSPDTDEEFSEDSSSDLEDLTHAPLLHISEVVKEPLKTLTAALEVLLPRLKPSPEVKGISIEDQESFVSILIGELGSRFSVLNHQIDDPFLDAEQNRRLHRQISVDVCTIIEQLYGKFIYKAAKLSESALTLSSSMILLRAQLTTEANKRLNIPAIRRGVLKRLRGPIVTEPVVQRYCSHAPRLPPVPRLRGYGIKVPKRSAITELEELQLGASLDSKLSRFGVRWESRAVRRRIRKLETRLPALQVAAASSDEETDTATPSWKEMRGSSTVAAESAVDITTDTPRFSRKLRRISSNPELYGDFLLCDLGYFTRHKRPENSHAKEEGMGLHRPPSVGEFLDLRLSEDDSQGGKVVTALGDFTPHQLADDLHTLEQHRAVSPQSFGEDDLHPLLQAHVHGLSHKQAVRLAEYEASLRKEEGPDVERLPCSSGLTSPLERSIPSVPTMDQLPYLNIEHASGADSSNASLLVKSGLLTKKGLADTSSGTFVSSSVRRLVTPSSGYLEEGSGRLTSHSNVGSQYTASQSNMEPQSSVGQDSDMEALGRSLEGTKTDLTHLSPPSSRASGSRTPHGEAGGDREQPCSPKIRSGSVMTDHEEWKGDMLDSLLPQEFEEAVKRGGESKSVGGPQPQTAAVTVKCPGQGIVRTADVRVSERTPLVQIRQKFFGPIYNELAEDWDSSTTEDLDSSMYQGKEITAVYEEIMKTLPTDHLKFSNEPTLEPSLQTPVKLFQILSSNTLNHRRTQRVINQGLHRNVPPPWGGVADRDKQLPSRTVRQAWEQSTEYKGADIELHQQGTSTPYTRDVSHHYHTWLSNWKANVNPEDFLKFISRQENDYMRLIYHLYDSEGSDSEDEAEHREKRARLVALQAKQRQKEVRKQSRFRAKSQFQSGMWNVNTVVMGGLGKDPGSSGSEEEDERENLRKLNEKASNMETVQKNLKQIWTRLLVPTAQQIDMAIKYSGEVTQTHLNKVLYLWESACDVIERRELALSQLESFERTASDPSRFFMKGPGSATVRLSEARERDRLHNELDKFDKKVSAVVQKLLKECGDVVTYKGRPYAEKMRLDRTEMLYWLQQARRQVALRPSIKSLTLEEGFNTPPGSHVSKSISGH